MDKSISGPTQIKNISALGTGLSDEAVSFLTANCSPFTNPRDLPCEPKVPDPRMSDVSNTAFVWQAFTIPGVQNLQADYEQIVMTSADPFAPCPITWATTLQETDKAPGASATACLGYRTPNSMAIDYENAKISSMVNRLHSLKQKSKAYRVVGHGLKIWVSRNTNIQRGTLECGQYTYANSRNTTVTSPGTRACSTQTWPTNMGTDPQGGAQSTMMQSTGLVQLRRSIELAKDQEVGFYNADEGCVVRWTDSNEYKMQPTVNRSMVYPLSQTFKGAYAPFDAMQRDGTTGLPSPTFGTNLKVYPTHMEYDLAGVATVPSNKGVNELCSMKYFSSEAGWYVWPLTITGSNPGYGFVDEPTRASPFGDLQAYTRNADLQFNKGLFVDIQGFGSNQLINVQVCWQIEYLPQNGEPWYGVDSPVDMNFDALSTLARDRAAFPIHNSGGAFFTDFRLAYAKSQLHRNKIFVRSDTNEVAESLARRRRY